MRWPSRPVDWSASVITADMETAPGTFQNIARWKLWLNGEQLRFSGFNGQHVHEGEQYSFLTISDGLLAGSYFRLGEIAANEVWDFEFDCVAYQDDLNNGEPLICEPSPDPCGPLWADANGDGDVDQQDFAILQRCYTGPDGDVSPEGHCPCFDRDEDADVDVVDVEAFVSCATGPEVPFDLDNLPSGCVP